MQSQENGRFARAGRPFSVARDSRAGNRHGKDLIAGTGADAEMALSQEVELKLELAPEVADALEQSAVLPLESSVEPLFATYFDTPDRKLHAHGLSLRIRQSSSGRVQTVKASGTGSGGLFARAEWEMAVRDSDPVVDSRTPVGAVLNDDDARLAPIFHVEVSRRTWVLSEQEATIEIVMDRGKVRAGERECAVCEIELELKAGRTAALFALARGIGKVAAVRPGVLTKAERGYRLLDAAQFSFKADPVALEPSMDMGTAFRTIAQACIRHYRLNENLLLARYDPQALHQARVAVRRLRSAMSIFKPFLGDGGSDKVRDELRWFAGVLGRARDLDVLSARTDIAEIHEAVEQARLREHGEVIKQLESQKVRAFWLDLLEWLHSRKDAPHAAVDMASFARNRLDHFRRRIAKHGKNMQELNDEARHEVRKDAKKLRYAAEFFAGLFDGRKPQKRYGKFIQVLQDLQDELGGLNDLVSAPAIFAEHGLSRLHIPHEETQRRKLISAAARAHSRWAKARRFWR